MSPCTTFNPHQSTGGTGVTPPTSTGHALIALLSREKAIEGSVGTCEVKWATGWPATSKVYISVVSNTGPWTKVVDDATAELEHSFTFSALGNQQHWYYVESVSDALGLETSSVQTFDADANPHALTSVMGKERSCEGDPGNAWVKWATGRPGTSVIYVSIVSNTGPWTTVVNNATEVTSHEFIFPILAVGSTHWFYVESLSDGEGLEVSDVFTFCTSGEITLTIGALTMLPTLIVPTLQVHPVNMNLFTDSIDLTTEQEESLIDPLITGWDFTILTDVSLAFTEDGFSTSVTITP